MKREGEKRGREMNRWENMSEERRRKMRGIKHEGRKGDEQMR